MFYFISAVLARSLNHEYGMQVAAHLAIDTQYIGSSGGVHDYSAVNLTFKKIIQLSAIFAFSVVLFFSSHLKMALYEVFISCSN